MNLQGEGRFLTLPPFAKRAILDFGTPEDLLRVQACCGELRVVANGDGLWNTHLLRLQKDDASAATAAADGDEGHPKQEQQQQEQQRQQRRQQRQQLISDLQLTSSRQLYELLIRLPLPAAVGLLGFWAAEVITAHEGAEAGGQDTQQQQGNRGQLIHIRTLRAAPALAAGSSGSSSGGIVSSGSSGGGIVSSGSSSGGIVSSGSSGGGSAAPSSCPAISCVRILFVKDRERRGSVGSRPSDGMSMSGSSSSSGADDEEAEEEEHSDEDHSHENDNFSSRTVVCEQELWRAVVTHQQPQPPQQQGGSVLVPYGLSIRYLCCADEASQLVIQQQRPAGADTFVHMEASRLRVVGPSSFSFSRSLAQASPSTRYYKLQPDPAIYKGQSRGGAARGERHKRKASRSSDAQPRKGPRAGPRADTVSPTATATAAAGGGGGGTAAGQAGGGLRAAEVGGWDAGRAIETLRSSFAGATSGLVRGVYNSHGAEILHAVILSDDERRDMFQRDFAGPACESCPLFALSSPTALLTGRKVIGDANVPAGHYSFVVSLSKNVTIEELQQSLDAEDDVVLLALRNFLERRRAAALKAREAMEEERNGGAGEVVGGRAAVRPPPVPALTAVYRGFGQINSSQQHWQPEWVPVMLVMHDDEHGAAGAGARHAAGGWGRNGNRTRGQRCSAFGSLVWGAMGFGGYAIDLDFFL